jgi:hypothetical protein
MSTLLFLSKNLISERKSIAIEEDKFSLHEQIIENFYLKSEVKYN